MVQAPHIGHLYTLVLTDILKRWQILQGRKAILITGTDEHGMKVGLNGFVHSPAEMFRSIGSESGRKGRIGRAILL